MKIPEAVVDVLTRAEVGESQAVKSNCQVFPLTRSIY
jgi:hypothetical protein